MPINTDLLIAAPIMQDYFSDKNGVAMAGGTITLYHDNSRTTLKNWYYQTGTPGTYTYLPLPNPLTLSAAGTITDINGVDTIPFFYPYLESDNITPDPYYITIVNHAQTNQITRANFPFIAGQNNIADETVNLNNLIVNGGFWRNIEPNYVNRTPLQSVTLNNFAVAGAVNLLIAPSQHDGFTNGDIRFIKNNTSATDFLTFVPFPLTNSLTIPKPPTVTPENYISHFCNGAGTGETQKCYQFPIALHVNNLANYPYTVSIQAQNPNGTGPGQATISLYIYQFTGTGTTSPAPFLIGNTTITLSPQWKTYTLTDIFPSTAGLTLGQGEDDALYLQVQMPLNVTCGINFTKPSIYLTQDIASVNDFETYDEVNTVISSPRTGDVRVSLNQFAIHGWVPMNDGVIGINNPTHSGFYILASPESWQLYNLIWDSGKAFDTGIPYNAVSQMYNNTTFAPINYGVSAYADFIAGNALQLTKMMGNVIIGTVPIQDMLNGTNKQVVTITNDGAGNILVTGTNGNYFFQGQPVAFLTSANGVFTGAVYYVANYKVGGGGTFNLAANFVDAMAGITLVPYVSDGGNIVFTDIPGATTGQYAHSQLLSEIPNHSHDPTIVGGSILEGVAAGGSGVVSVGTTVLNAATTGGITGYPLDGQRSFNVTQPGTFYNIFMKL